MPTGKVERTPLEGGASETLFEGEGVPLAMALARDVLVVVLTARIIAVPVGGGEATELWGGYASCMALDGDVLYFASSNELRRLALGGGEATRVAELAGQVAALAVDARHIYAFTVTEEHAFAGGDLVRLPKDGGAPSTIARALARPAALADVVLTGERIIWAQESPARLLSVPLAGGTVEIWAEGGAFPARAGELLSWRDGAGIWQMPLDGGERKLVLERRTGSVGPLQVAAPDLVWVDASAGRIVRVRLGGP